METYLKREVYNHLLAWKKQPRHMTLEVSGARQVGKTYIVNKFADEQYTAKIYVNLLDFSGELFLEIYNELRRDIKNGSKVENPVHELIKRYSPDFIDSTDTVVIIDEIQESADIYNRIREFTRYLKSDFIVTGSYLGRIIDKKFKYSSGDMDSIEIHTLNFQEFLDALEKYPLLKELDLYGASNETVYDNLEQLFRIYCGIGGYPGVVLKHINGASYEECQKELLRIIRLFANESQRYFEDILDEEVYDNIFCSIARVLVKEKKGFREDSFSEELQSIVTKDYSSNISKASVNRAIDWLYSSGIIGFAGKLPECNILDYKSKARCYFMDIGLTTYFLTKIGYRKQQRIGIVNENFVYLDLKRRTNHPAEIALETPAFATYGDGELDFFVMSLHSEKTYAVEVKSGKNSSKTVSSVLQGHKADYALFAKGNTHGGIVDNIFTIPIYGISKFTFS